MIDRPEIVFREADHAYFIDRERVPSPSSIAKLGSDGWGPGSAWGFKIGYQGAFEVLSKTPREQWPDTDEDLRTRLQRFNLTPWGQKKKAGSRGDAIHDALEKLAQDEVIPNPDDFPEERRGHVLSLVRWYLHFRPEFVATEVIIGSRTHKFAGRYDIRAILTANFEELGFTTPPLCLVDLKTSKYVYPTSHFPQLELYEGASVEMGYPATDGRFVLNTKPDGTFDPAKNFVRSWATFEQGLDYLGAFLAIRQIEADDPAQAVKAEQEQVILKALPGTAKDCGKAANLAPREAAGRLKGMRNRGLVTYDRGMWSAAA